MDNDDFLKDDFLGRLIRNSPLDSPPDDFVDRVMAGIQPEPEIVPAKKPFFLMVGRVVPYAVLVMLLLIVFATSDLPFLNWLPRWDYFAISVLPWFNSLFASLKTAFASKYVSMGLVVSISGGLLFLADRLFGRRFSL
jgi:hypothetical protein